MEAETARILRALADVQPDTSGRVLDVLRSGHPHLWRGYDTSMRYVDIEQTSAIEPATLPLSDRRVKRLAAIDALHEHERLLRAGWVWVVGRAEVDGRPRRVCTPLVTRSVTIRAGVLARATLLQAMTYRGDLELSPLVADPVTARGLLADVQWGGGALEGPGVDDGLIARLPRLQGWIHAVTRAMGLPVEQIQPQLDASRVADEVTDGLVAVVGTAIFVARDLGSPTQAATLQAWAEHPDVGDTAFARLFGIGMPDRPADPASDPGDADEVRSPLLLTASQATVVRRARTEPLVTVSGAPGNGKSHAVAAIAVDAVARGRSVLVATPSSYAADVIADLLARRPGPDPIVFGSSEARRAIADRLAAGHPGGIDPDAAARRCDEAWDELRAVSEVVHDALATEDVASGGTTSATLAQLGRRLPGLVDPEVDLDEVERLAREAGVTGDGPEGWFADWRRRRHRRELADRLGVSAFDDGVLRLGLRAASARRQAASLALHGGTQLEELWEALGPLERQARSMLGEQYRARAAVARTDGRDRRRAVAALATALRAGRVRRRELLAGLDHDDLVAALPLWVGDLRDIGDLLPEVCGLFDLVVLDEASQLDLARAAPALLRGRSAVVVGDPRQLRHVSFTSDDAMTAALAEHDLAHLAGVLDVRRVSAFDAAAGAAPVTFLAEHFRCAPHLIGFSIRRFYDHDVELMTRHPSVDTADVIDVLRVGPAEPTRPTDPDADGVVTAEVEVVARLLDELEADGVTSVGVVSPFRAQADAIEAWVLDNVELERIERLGLRVGTVHAFQGSERDVMVVSLGLTDEDAPQRRRFADDPHLANVMVTRARHRVVVVTALSGTPDGVVGDYLEWGERAPAAPADGDPPEQAFARTVTAELGRLGHVVRPGYRVGPHTIDVVVGDGRDATAVTMTVHPDGPEAHVARELELRRLGWRTVDAWPSRFEDDPIAAALHLDVLLSPP